jgi:hypothetical protein
MASAICPNCKILRGRGDQQQLVNLGTASTAPR